MIKPPILSQEKKNREDMIEPGVGDVGCLDVSLSDIRID
jgi:hypothetical protein